MEKTHVAPGKSVFNPANVDLLKHASEIPNISITVVVLEMEVTFNFPVITDIGHSLIINDSKTPTVGMSLSKSELEYVGIQWIDGKRTYTFHNKRGGMRVGFWR